MLRSHRLHEMAENNLRLSQDGPSFSFGEMALSAEPARAGLGALGGGGGSFPGVANGEEAQSAAEGLLREMRILMLNEEFSPEVLQYATETVDGVRALVAEQEDALDAVEFGGTQGEAPTGFETHIKRMEIDRVNYLLRAYFRVRIKKIQQSILFIFKDSATFDRLSKAEQKFAVSYMNLVENHFNRAFLSMLPEKLRKLDKDGHVHHAVPPNLDHFAFCRMRNTVGSYAVSEEATDDPIDLNEGDILCTRYSRIRELLIRGDAELV